MSAFATRQKVDASTLNRTSQIYNKIRKTLVLGAGARAAWPDSAGDKSR
jgi:hypothetical protein